MIISKGWFANIHLIKASTFSWQSWVISQVSFMPCTLFSSTRCCPWSYYRKILTRNHITTLFSPFIHYYKWWISRHHHVLLIRPLQLWCAEPPYFEVKECGGLWDRSQIWYRDVFFYYTVTTIMPLFFCSWLCVVFLFGCGVLLCTFNT